MAGEDKLIQEYRESKATITRLEGEMKGEEESKLKELDRIDDRYFPLKNELYQKQKKEIDAVIEASNKREAELQRKKEEATAILPKIQRIIGLLQYTQFSQLHKPENRRYMDKIKPYREEVYYERLKPVLYADEYLDINLAIVGIDNPTNKFELIALGICLFNRDGDLKKPYHYGLPSLRDDSGLAVRCVLHKGKTAEELKAYVERNRKRILSEFLEQYQAFKAEYEEVKSKYKLDAFKPLIDEYSNLGR